MAYGMVPEEVFSNPNLGDSAVRIYAALAKFRNRRTKRCNPSQKALAESTVKSIPTISRCLKELEKEGAIQRQIIDGRETLYILPHLEKEDDETPIKSETTPIRNETTPLKSEGATPIKSEGGPLSEMKKTPIRNENIPPHPPYKVEQTKNRQERERSAREENPMSLSDLDLLPPAPDFDEEACFRHYLAEKQKHHRTRFLDLEVRRAIQVLHGDPTIEPRLRTEEIQLILANWMEFGKPLKPHQIFEEHPTMNVPNWEACLWFARNRRNGSNRTRPQEEAIDVDAWLEENSWSQSK